MFHRAEQASFLLFHNILLYAKSHTYKQMYTTKVHNDKYTTRILR